MSTTRNKPCSILSTIGLLTALTVVNSWSPTVVANSANVVLNLPEFLKQNPDLIEFFELVGNNPQLSSTLEWNHGTLFVASNNSLSEYRRLYPGQLNDFTLLYHFVNTLVSTASMEETYLSTALPGSLPLWITKTESSIYINSAKILRPDKRVRIGKNGIEQIIHVLDSVLEATIPRVNVGNSSINNPDCKKYMELSNEYSISDQYSTSTFYRQVKAKGKLNLFDSQGKFTFFLPVNHAFESTRIGSVDERVIEGHLIVGKVLFTGPDSSSGTFETSAGAGNFPVQVILQKSRTPHQQTWLVTSDNLVQETSTDNNQHRKGRVQAIILKANIPVKNGVVHLINKPLVVIDANVYKTMEADTSSFLGFFQLIKDTRDTLGTDGQFESIRRILQDSSKRVTVFVPSSRVLAVSDNFQELINSTKSENSNERDKSLNQLVNIIKLHVVLDDITSENIISGAGNKTHPYSATPLAPGKQLFFNVIQSVNSNRNSIAVVDSGGTSAMISQADIGATNGVLHSIDRILGIGDNTIYDRLKTDPILTSTFNLTHQSRFIEIFRLKNKQFTFLVPSNSAWDGIKYESPSAYSTLFQGLHEGTTKTIMERHLIPAHAYSLDDLIKLSNTGGNRTVDLKSFRTVRGEIRAIRYNDTEFGKYNERYGNGDPRKNLTRYHGPLDTIFFWNKLQVRVIAGNIKCANGYIHVIDTVLMTRSDVVVNSVNSITPVALGITLFTVLALILQH